MKSFFSAVLILLTLPLLSVQNSEKKEKENKTKHHPSKNTKVVSKATVPASIKSKTVADKYSSSPKLPAIPKQKEQNPFTISRSTALTMLEMEDEKFSLKVMGRRFAQGEVMVFHLVPKMPIQEFVKEHFSIEWNGKPVPMTSMGTYFLGFAGIGPEEPEGKKNLVLKSSKLFFQRTEKSYEIDVVATDFQVVAKQEINLAKKYVDKPLSPETIAFIQECSKKKTEAFTSNTELKFKEGFSFPLKDIYITSSFYLRRDYNKTKGKPHGGVDFRGAQGAPIKAIQDGVVVLSQPMYYEGNFVILDHGNKIFSFYMHLSKLDKSVGDVVKKGDKIGEVGSTGMSTGPHLHLGAKVDGVLVDPLSLLAIEKL